MPRIKRTKITMNRCPECGHHDGDGFTFQEVGTRVCWQPVRLGLLEIWNPNQEPGGTKTLTLPDIDTIDYREYDTGDDVTVERYECTNCWASWPTLADLRAAQVTAWRVQRAEAEA